MCNLYLPHHPSLSSKLFPSPPVSLLNLPRLLEVSSLRSLVDGEASSLDSVAEEKSSFAAVVAEYLHLEGIEGFLLLSQIELHLRKEEG